MREVGPFPMSCHILFTSPKLCHTHMGVAKIAALLNFSGYNTITSLGNRIADVGGDLFGERVIEIRWS